MTSPTDLQLKDYQEREIIPLLERKRGGITWDMGLGKTVGATTIGAKARCLRWLIIAPDNAHSVWRDTAPEWIKRWTNEGVSVRVDFIEGSADVRELHWNAPYDPHVVHLKICTIDSFIRDWANKVKTGLKGKRSTSVSLIHRPKYNVPEIVIYDEARRLRNKDTQAFRVFSQWITYYDPTYLYLMTGTPGHEPKHFWTMLHLIDRKYFSSYWTFVRAFHEVDDAGFGMQVNEPKNIEAWHHLLRRHFSVVRKTDPGVADQLPPSTRQLLEIQMDKEQSRIYDELTTEMMTTQGDDIVFAQNEFVQLLRLRQVLVCPQMLHPEWDVGSAIKDFADTLGAPDEVTHEVLFTPFKAAFEPFTKFLRSKGHNRIWHLQGGMGTPERDHVLQSWKAGGGIILCTIQYAQAFSLEPAAQSFFIGYDWDPDSNRQAEDRLHRLTTTYPVNHYYYTYRSTIDHIVAHTVNVKQQRVNVTLPSQVRELICTTSSSSPRLL